jgi:hypothetical protein
MMGIYLFFIQELMMVALFNSFGLVLSCNRRDCNNYLHFPSSLIPMFGIGITMKVPRGRCDSTLLRQPTIPLLGTRTVLKERTPYRKQIYLLVPPVSTRSIGHFAAKPV